MTEAIPTQTVLPNMSRQLMQNQLDGINITHIRLSTKEQVFDYRYI